MTQDTAALDRIRRALRSEFRDLLDVGKVGEAIVATEHPDWTRAPPGQHGWDLMTPTGQKVQAKTWGKAAPHE
jgi:hypothetical protein